MDVSFIIPTFNSEKTLHECLRSIRFQSYPEDKYEIIISDAGSTDNTIKIAKKFKANKIVKNPLKTAEAGKAVAVKHAKGKIIALVDSDNILPTRNWLIKMLEPFEDKEIAGTEPLYYTYRESDAFITRYSALIGANDPLCIYLGNYDRYSFLTNKWTEMPIDIKDKEDYLKIELNERKIPTIGANGFLFRRELLKDCSIKDYFFDIDVVWELVKSGHAKFAKVKIGIVHIFSGNIRTFIKKQKRRVKDFLYYNKIKLRKYPWGSLSKLRLLKFVLYNVLVIPLLVQSLIGYIRKRDKVWLFHPVACWITLFVYSFSLFKSFFVHSKIEDRTRWSQ